MCKSDRSNSYASFLEEERQDPHGELDNCEKLGSNSPPIGKYDVSKIPWTGRQICYYVYIQVIQFNPYKPGVLFMGLT